MFFCHVLDPDLKTTLKMEAEETLSLYIWVISDIVYIVLKNCNRRLSLICR